MKKLFLLIITVALCLFFPLSVYLSSADKGGFSVYEKVISKEYDMDKTEAIIKTILVKEDGISFRLRSNKETFVKNMKAKVIAVEHPDNVEVTDYFSPYIRRWVLIDGKRVNMQIAVDIYGNVTVGTPVIIGSY